jgi:hypothetical protein
MGDRMNGSPPNLTDIIQAIASLLSILIATYAIIIARRSDNETVERELKVAAANIKPLLAIETDEYENMKGVILVNHGIGTAVITKIVITKNGETDPEDMNKLVNFMYQDIDEKWDFTWDYFSEFTPGHKQFIDAGMKLYLAKLSEDDLAAKSKLKKTELRKIFNDWDNQLSGVRIYIEYEDILGNKQENCVRDF